MSKSTSNLEEVVISQIMPELIEREPKLAKTSSSWRALSSIISRFSEDI